MRRLARTGAATVLLVLGLSPLALASGTIAGKYSAKISTPSALKGTWVLSFAKGGTYSVSDSGTVVIRGRYTSAGSKITLGHETGPAACSTSGTYSWKRTGKTLKLTRISDSACAGRSQVLGHTFTATG